MNTKRRAAARDAILITLALILLAAAGLYTWTRSSEPRAPTDESTWVYYRCTACGERFHYNGQELNDLQAGSPGGPHIGGTGGVPCKLCGKRTAVREPIKP